MDYDAAVQRQFVEAHPPFEHATHADGIDWYICSVIQDVIQDDLGWNMHISLIQFFGELVDRLDGDLDDQV